MTKEDIDEVVIDIMINFGPDGHCDGHEIITEFIIAITEGRAQEWVDNYKNS